MRISLLLILSALPALGQGLLNPYAFAIQTSSLNNGLVSYWKLDEEITGSGPVARADSEPTGTLQTLTDNNTVTSAPGLIGNSGVLIAGNIESLSRADSADLSMGDVDMTMSLWASITSKASSRDLIGKWGASGAYEYLVYYTNTTDRIAFSVSGDGTAVTVVTASNFGSPALGTLYNIVVWHDSVNNQIGIKINNGTANTATHSTGIYDGTVAFGIGARQSGSALFWQGLVDEVGIWKRTLTVAEITELYASGVGKTCCPVAP